jgi:hypothetical protein
MAELENLTLTQAGTQIASAGIGETDAANNLSLRMMKWLKIVNPAQARGYVNQVVRVSGPYVDGRLGTFNRDMVFVTVGDTLSTASLRPR